MPGRAASTPPAAPGPDPAAGSPAAPARIGLRYRALVMIVAATLPMAVLLGATLLADHADVLRDARDRALEAARIGADSQSDLLEEARTLLGVVALMPEVTGSLAATPRDARPAATPPGPPPDLAAPDGRPDGRPDGAADGPAAATPAARCHAVLAMLARAHPEFRTIGVARADGTITCHSAVLDSAATFTDTATLRRALAAPEGAFTVGPLSISRVTGRPTMPAALRLAAGPADPAPGIVFIGLNLDWFADVAARLSQQRDRVAEMIQPATGTVIARAPDPHAWIGRSDPDAPIMRALRDHPQGGTADVPGLDGVPRLYGFAPLPDAGGSGTMVAVGLNRDEVTSSADLRLRLGLGIACLALLAVCAAAWRLADARFARPIMALERVARRLGGGDLSARVDAASWPVPELRMLGTTMNDMAGSLAASQADLARSGAELRLLAENARDVIVHLGPDLRWSYVSPACRAMLGYEPEDMVGQSPLALMHPDDRARYRAAIGRLRPGWAGESTSYRCRRSDGTYIWVESSVRHLPGNEGYVTLIRDIEHVKEAEARLADANAQLTVLASRDSLTDLANRRHFDEALGDAFARAFSAGESLGLVMIDVDWFKPYNDCYGHPAGDACLRAIADALGGVLRRPGDLVARYGGEEFAVMLPGIDAAHAPAIAERMREAVRALDIRHERSPFGRVTVSVGVATLVPRHEQDTHAVLLRAADSALYRSKEAGRDQVSAVAPRDPPRLHVVS